MTRTAPESSGPVVIRADRAGELRGPIEELSDVLLATLHRIAWRMLRDEAAAAHTVDEAVLRSRGALSCLPSTGSQRAYLLTVVRQLCHHEQRRRQRVVVGLAPRLDASDVVTAPRRAA